MRSTLSSITLHFLHLGLETAHLVKYIQSEISVIPIYENMPHYTESINCFESEGYRLISLVPVTREKETGFVIEFDALWGRHI